MAIKAVEMVRKIRDENYERNHKVIGNKEYTLHRHQWFNQNVVFG